MTESGKYALASLSSAFFVCGLAAPKVKSAASEQIRRSVWVSGTYGQAALLERNVQAAIDHRRDAGSYARKQVLSRARVATQAGDERQKKCGREGGLAAASTSCTRHACLTLTLTLTLPCAENHDSLTHGGPHDPRHTTAFPRCERGLILRHHFDDSSTLPVRKRPSEQERKTHMSCTCMLTCTRHRLKRRYLYAVIIRIIFIC